MKGPMTTQTLRGMANQRRRCTGAATARADVSAATRSTRTPSFNNFIVAFEGLLGRDDAARRRRHAGVHRLHAAGHAAAEPDPRARQLAHRRPAGGHEFLHAAHAARTASRIGDDLGFNCNGCHALDPAQGFFGTDGDVELRGRAADREDRRTCATCTRRSACSACRGRRRSSAPATTASRATRSAASASCTTAASTRVFRFFSAHGVQAAATASASTRSASTATRQRRDVGAVHARLRQRPGADRRPAGHARRSTNAAVAGARIDLLIQRSAARSRRRSRRDVASATWS